MEKLVYVVAIGVATLVVAAIWEAIFPPKPRQTPTQPRTPQGRSAPGAGRAATTADKVRYFTSGPATFPAGIGTGGDEGAPTEAQINALAKHGVFLPEGATERTASIAITLGRIAEEAMLAEFSTMPKRAHRGPATVALARAPACLQLAEQAAKARDAFHNQKHDRLVTEAVPAARAALRAWVQAIDPDAPSPNPALAEKARLEALQRWREAPARYSGYIQTGGELTLIYEAANDEESKRDIRLRCLCEKGGRLYLDAFCMERDAPRQFRADRILELTDAETGEVVAENVSAWLIDRFGPIGAPDERRAERRRRAQPEAQLDVECEVVLLVAAGRADGRFVAAERDVVLDYVAARVAEKGGVFDPQARERLEKRIKALKPTPEDVAAAGKTLASSAANEKTDFLDALARLTDADGKSADAEIAFAEETERALYA